MEIVLLIWYIVDRSTGELKGTNVTISFIEKYMKGKVYTIREKVPLNRLDENSSGRKCILT